MPPEESDIARRRSEWFYGQRAFPHQYVPAGARRAASRAVDAMIAAGAFSRNGPTAQWTLIGPQPTSTPFVTSTVSGRVSAIAVDPRSNNTVYLGGAQGGVWKTTDGGANWTALTDTQASLATGSITLDPSNPDIVYVGTGEENFSGDSYYGAGILESTDAGATWTNLPGPFAGPVGADGYYGGGARIGGLAVSPTNNQVLLAAVLLLGKDGIYRSTNGGVAWTQVISGGFGNSVLFAPPTAKSLTRHWLQISTALPAACSSPATAAPRGRRKMEPARTCSRPQTSDASCWRWRPAVQ